MSSSIATLSDDEGLREIGINQGDFHHLLMAYGVVCEEQGALSPKAVTIRMDIAAHYNETMALISQKIIEARMDELDAAITMTRQTFHTGSPFTNVENINGQVIAATAQYLITRRASLTTKQDTKEKI